MKKVCSNCKQEKLLLEFHKDKKTTSGFTSRCKECALSIVKEWGKSHPDLVKLHKAKWREANPDYHTQYNKVWEAKHPELKKQYSKKWYLANKEKEAARRKLWRQENPEKVKLVKQARYHRVRAGGVLTRQIIESVYDKYSKTCVSCLSKENLTLDHIKPVILGGDNSISNLQILCKLCNSRKGIKYEKQLQYRQN